MKKLYRIESRERFNLNKRVHYIHKMTQGITHWFTEGREMKEEEIGDKLSMYIAALNAAEEQISYLLDIVHQAEVHEDYFDQYFDEFQEDEDYEHKYRVQDLKDSIHVAMMKKDEKAISRYLNELNLLTEKKKHATLP